MGIILKIIIGVATCLTILSCGTKTDAQKAVDDANKSIEQTKHDMDKSAEDAKKSVDEANKANEIAMDATSGGGQPGSISLAGAMVSNDGIVDSKILVELLAGKSWKAQRPDVKNGTLVLKSKLSDSPLFQGSCRVG